MKVAAYYRKSPSSKDAIEASIEQQQKEVRAYAKERGWTIVSEYTDGGKSGSKDTQARTQFLRMIEDSKAKEWEAVLVWHTNRFARLDSIDVGEFAAALRKNGVHLESLKQGKIDLKSKQGRMALFMYSESDNDHSVNVSGDTLRGRMKAIEDGYWPHGQVPWGYDRQLIDPQGHAHDIVPRHQKSLKPIKWHIRLVRNKAEAKIIGDIFEQFGEQDVSLRQLALRLSANGINSPSGKTDWNVSSVAGVLRNPAYAGDVTIGGVHRTGGRKGKFNKAEKTTKQSSQACPPIVSRELWDRVQKRLADRKATGRKPNARASALSGVLVCGHCGHRMVKKSRNGKTYYVCTSKQTRPSTKCNQWRVHEEFILPKITKLLVESLDYEVIRKMQSRPKAKFASDVLSVKSQIAEMEKKIERANKNLLLADPSLFLSLQKMSLGLKSEKDKLENTLALITADDQYRHEAIEWLNGIKNKIKIMVPDMAKPFDYVESDPPYDGGCGEIKPGILTDADQVRELLHRLHCTVTLWWDKAGSRYFCLSRGHLKAEFGENLLDLNKNTPSYKVLRIDRDFGFRGDGSCGNRYGKAA